MEPGIKKNYDKYGFSNKPGAGPEGTGPQSTYGIKQGEHIISLHADNGGEYLRLHVHKSQAGNETTWHWHELSDGFSDHKIQTKLKHNTLPKWGSPE